MLKDFFNKFSIGLMLNILIRIKSVIYLPILVNLLSKESVGEMTYYITIASLLVSFTVFNIPDSSNRFFKLDSKSDKKDRQIFNYVISLCLIGVVSVTLIFIVIYNIFSVDSTTITLVYLYLVSKVVNKISVFYHQIKQNVKIVSLSQLAIEYTSLLFLVFAWWKSINVNVDIIIVANTVINISVSMFLMFKNLMFRHYRFMLNYQFAKKILKVSMFLVPSLYLMLIIQYGDVLVIEHFLGKESVADYTFANSMASLVVGFQMALSLFWFSKVTRMNKNEKEYFFDKAQSGMNLLIILVFCFYYLVIEELIILINKEYIMAVSSTIILATAYVHLVGSQLYVGSLYADKKENRILLTSVAGMVVNVVINLSFVEKFGIEIAAISTFISYFLMYNFNKFFSGYYSKKATIGILLNILFLFFWVENLWI